MMNATRTWNVVRTDINTAADLMVAGRALTDGFLIEHDGVEVLWLNDTIDADGIADWAAVVRVDGKWLQVESVSFTAPGRYRVMTRCVADAVRDGDIDDVDQVDDDAVRVVG